MELLSSEQWWQIPLLVLSLAMTILISKRKKNATSYNTPPGPKGLPVIGNLHQLSAPAHKCFTDLAHKYGPVFSLRLGSVNTVVLSSYETAKEFFKSNDSAFASRPPTAIGKSLYDYSGIALTPYGPDWREGRRLCTLQLLTVKQVQTFAPVRSEEIDLMSNKLWDNSNQGTVPVDVSKAVQTLTTNIIWRIICGRKFNDNEEVADGLTFPLIVLERARIIGEFNLGDFIPWLGWIDVRGINRRIARNHALYDILGEKILSQRMSYPRISNTVDFLDILLGEGISRGRVKGLMFDMAGAATETTATTIDWTLSLLLKNRDVLEKVQKEMDEAVGKDGKVEEKHLDKLKYLQCVVRESMRLHPTVPLGIPHYSIEDTTLCGYRVPKGSILFVNIRAINRDPAVWEDAEEFIPERFMKDELVDLHGYDLRSIPFSAGRRGCPGIGMALPIILLTLSTLVHRFNWSLSGELDMDEGIGITAPRKTHVLAIPHLRWTTS